MAKINIDRRVKIERQVEIKIIAMLRRWNSKITWDLLIDRIKVELDISVTKPTLCKYDRIKTEFNKAKSRYNCSAKLPSDALKKITADEVGYYKKYMLCKEELDVMQENLDAQLALIDKMLKNAEEHPNITVQDLLRDRAENY
ncbi:MAG: hypothetical protein HUJ13_03810 [Hydrogenovibrio crunogenus]|uniref:Uncharacterized protein n=1 Tax=Hydrogenovibrio crunogenus (strain DSM 25203 / XCL-2) TaxID=317025 RepID=Q31JJ2_HYDCU|nr:hypothetical protein [Hydrogenovibrio crunogenus]